MQHLFQCENSMEMMKSISTFQKKIKRPLEVSQLLKNIYLNLIVVKPPIESERVEYWSCLGFCCCCRHFVFPFFATVLKGLIVEVPWVNHPTQKGWVYEYWQKCPLTQLKSSFMKVPTCQRECKKKIIEILVLV